MSRPQVMTSRGWRAVRRPRPALHPGVRDATLEEAAAVFRDGAKPKLFLRYRMASAYGFDLATAATYDKDRPGLVLDWTPTMDARPRRAHIDFETYSQAPFEGGPPVLGRFNCRGDYILPDRRTIPARTPNNFVVATGDADALPGAACNRRYGFYGYGAAVPAEPRWWQSRDGRSVPVLIGGFVVVCAVIGAALGVAAIMLNP